MESQALEIVVVTAPRGGYGGGGFGGGFWGGGHFDTNGGIHDPGDYGDGDPDPLTITPPPPLTECQLDAILDSYAVIASFQADLRNREQGLIMWYDRESGLAGFTPLVTGDLDSVRFDSTTLPSFVSSDEVVGLFHSHPRGQSQPGSLGSYPSNNNGGLSGMDWQTADIMTGQGTVTYRNADNIERTATGWGANPATFRHYIEGPDGVVREFSYSQRNYFAGLTESQRINGVGLPAGVSVHTCSPSPTGDSESPDASQVASWTYSGGEYGYFLF